MKHTVRRVKLKNGAEGLLIHVPDASVMNFEFNFRAGEYLVEREKWETPHLMEHVLLGANKLIPKARDFQAEFDKNGAYNNASTGPYDITYEAECADFEWDRILELLITAIAEPLFLKEEFEAEFNNVKEELSARSNNHFRNLGLALREEFGFLVVGDRERIKLMDNVTVNDVKRHYKRTHTSSNMRFVIAGNLVPERRQAIRKLISKINLPEGEGRQALPIETPKPLDAPLFIANPTVDNIYFYLDTFANRRMRDPEVDALNLINSMLTETLYSRILGKAREKGLVYSMSSGLSQTENNSNWWFGAQVMPNNSEALFSIIISELKHVFSGKLKEEDSQAAKQYALGKYQRSGQTVGGTLMGYSNRYFFDGEIEYYHKFPARIRAITKDRILAASKAMFADKIWGLGVLGGTDKKIAERLNEQISTLWRS